MRRSEAEGRSPKAIAKRRASARAIQDAAFPFSRGEKMQIDNTKLLEALKHIGRPDAEKSGVLKELGQMRGTCPRFNCLDASRQKRPPHQKENVV